MKQWPNLQLLFASFWLWIQCSPEKLARNVVLHHTATPTPPASPSPIKTLSYQPITDLWQSCTSAYCGERERHIEGQWERAENVRLAMHSNFLPSTPLQPSKERKRGRKRDGSHSCWPPCSCCFNMPRSHLPCHSLQDSTAFFPPILPCVLNLLFCLQK